MEVVEAYKIRMNNLSKQDLFYKSVKPDKPVKPIKASPTFESWCQMELTVPDGGKNSQDFRKGIPECAVSHTIRRGLSLEELPGAASWPKGRRGESPTAALLLWGGAAQLTPQQGSIQTQPNLIWGLMWSHWSSLTQGPALLPHNSRPADATGWGCTGGSVTGHPLDSLGPRWASGPATDHLPVKKAAHLPMACKPYFLYFPVPYCLAAVPKKAK